MLGQFAIGSFSLERGVSQRPVLEVIADERVGMRAKMMCSAGPTYLPQSRASFPIDWQPLDIAHAIKQVAFRFDHGGSEAAFPQAPGVAMAPVESAAITPTDGLHQTAEAITRRWRRKHAHLCIEQSVSMNGHPHGGSRRLHQAEKQLTIDIVTKHGLMVVTLLNQQVGPAGDAKAG